MSSTTASADNVKEFVETTIAENDVVVFAKSWCPYSKKTKATLSTLNTEGKNVKIVDIDLDFGQPFGQDAVQNYLQEKTGQRTVPNTFIRQQHIGGNDSFQAKGTEALQKLIDGTE